MSRKQPNPIPPEGARKPPPPPAPPDRKTYLPPVCNLQDFYDAALGILPVAMVDSIVAEARRRGNVPPKYVIIRPADKEGFRLGMFLTSDGYWNTQTVLSPELLAEMKDNPAIRECIKEDYQIMIQRAFDELEEHT